MRDETGFRSVLRLSGLSFATEPLGYARVSTAQDAIEVIKQARDEQLPLLSRPEGRFWKDGLSDAVFIDVKPRDAIRLNLERRSVYIPAGATWEEVMEASTPHGLCPPHSAHPGDDAVDFVLHSGIGPLARRYGLASSLVLEVTLVSPSGQLLTTSEFQEPDLFWAIRGGGGGFGIVLGVELQLLPIYAIQHSRSSWRSDALPETVRHWREWALQLDWAAGASLRVTRSADGSAYEAIAITYAIEDEWTSEVLAGALLGSMEPEATHADVVLSERRRVDTRHLPAFWRENESGAIPEPAPRLDAIPLHADALQLLCAVTDLREGDFLSIQRLGGALGNPLQPGGVLDQVDAPFAVTLGLADPTNDLDALAQAVAAWSAQEPDNARLDLATIRHFFDQDSLFLGDAIVSPSVLTAGPLL